VKLVDTNVLLYAVNADCRNALSCVPVWNMASRPTPGASAPHAHLLEATSRHWPLLQRLFVGAGTAGNLSNDAHLSALAIEHGATLFSFDRDFDRFAGSRLELIQG
jgi:predicted nucleic acid-binding protein